MKKSILHSIILIALSFSFTCSAQLFVKPSGPEGAEIASYIYVNDTFLYVDQDVNLEINPNDLAETSIILRNEAQLLQGNGNDQQNKGTGDISIFQEGTVNAWDYNFWASPVGLSFNGVNSASPDGNSIFASQESSLSGFTSTVLFYPTSLTESQLPILIGGFDSTTGTNAPLNFATYWLWSFQSGVNAGVDYADWIHIDDTGSLAAGLGFTMKGVNGTDTTDAGDGVINNDGNLTNGTGQRFDFRGRPNNGTIEVEVGANNALTLVGNPYPSALDLDYFLLQNSGAGNFAATDANGTVTNVTRSDIITGVALFWDSNPNVMSHFIEDYQGGYGMYSPLMTLGDGMYVNATFFMYDETGAQIPDSDDTTSQATAIDYDRRFSPVGQGFMIQGSGGGNAVFTNNQRIFVQEGNNSDFRNSESSAPVPGIGVSSYYPDVNNMPADYPRIKIGVGINDTYSRELGIGLHENATSGYDVAGDARIGGLPTDVSFSIEDGKGYIINAAPQDEFQFLPITLDAETPSEFRFIAHYTENFTYEGVYLFDNQTETYYDILSDNSTLIQLEAGEHKDRFSIAFTTEPEDTSDNDDTTQDDDDDDTTLSVEEVAPVESILESLTVIQNNASDQLEIHNPLGASLDTMSLFDMAGKLVISKNELGTQSVYSFPTSNLSTGIYIAQFNTTEGLTKARKISIVN